MEMEYISLVDTSLDLNANPLRLFDDVQINKKVESNFIELGRKMSMKEESSALVEELNRLNEENKKLTEMLTVLCENYNTLRNQLMDYTSKNPPGSTDNMVVISRKRKAEISNDGGNINSDQTSSSSDDHQDSSCKKLIKEDEHAKSKISRVYVRTQASDTGLIVKDGYQWRKYGQKVTRDNPSPRAYFKCSFAPTCPVKKKVQRSVEDQSVLVATYEGEHNHPHSVESTTTTTSSNRGGTMTLLGSSGPSVTTTIDHLTKTPYSQPNHTTTTLTTTAGTDDKIPSQATIKSPEFQQFLVEQMASSLTKDPGFKAALAAAISGRFLQQNNNQTEKW